MTTKTEVSAFKKNCVCLQSSVNHVIKRTKKHYLHSKMDGE